MRRELARESQVVDFFKRRPILFFERDNVCQTPHGPLKKAVVVVVRWFNNSTTQGSHTEESQIFHARRTILPVLKERIRRRYFVLLANRWAIRGLCVFWRMFENPTLFGVTFPRYTIFFATEIHLAQPQSDSCKCKEKKEPLHFSWPSLRCHFIVHWIFFFTGCTFWQRTLLPYLPLGQGKCNTNTLRFHLFVYKTSSGLNFPILTIA